MIISDFSGANAGVILSVMIGVTVLCVLFLLYMKNKRWWIWKSVGTVACCEEAYPQAASKLICKHTLATKMQDNDLHKLKIDCQNPTCTSEVTNYMATEELLQQSLDFACTPRPVNDLMSLVEKGRIGVNKNSSYCSSIRSSVGDKYEITPHKLDSEFTETETRYPRDGQQSVQNLNISQNTRQNEELGTQDCVVMVNVEKDERDDLMSIQLEPEQTKLCGRLQVTLVYDAPLRKMTVQILQARDIPNPDSACIHTQVRVVLLPSKKQKCKTKIRSGENPQFMENFLLHRINPEDVNSMSARLRLYICERMKKEKLLGESIINFATLNLEMENNFWLTLDPKADSVENMTSNETTSPLLTRSESAGSTISVLRGGVPELLLGLCYNATTGRLAVEVVKGSHFRNFTINRAPDTYVKLNLVSSTGQELAHSKTTIRRGQINPVFKEAFIFQVTLFQLADVTLLVSVYNRRGLTMKKEMIGWFSLGLNSSGAEELAHWMDMKELQQEQICRWHILVQS